MFNLIRKVSVYVREIHTCVVLIVLKTMIFFPHVAKGIRQLQFKQLGGSVGAVVRALAFHQCGPG